MSDTQPLGTSTATAEHPPAAPIEPDARQSLRERKLGWLPVLAVAVTAVVLGALIGFGLGRVTGDSSGGGPGGFGGPGRGQFQNGFPGQPGQQGQQGQPGQPGQPGQQFGGTQPQQPAT